MSTNGGLYYIYNLSNNLEEALEAAKDILSSVSIEPTEAILSLEMKNIKYYTTPIFLRKKDAMKVTSRAIPLT